MKKKKWTLLLILVLLVLVIPIPSGRYKDGGTKTYSALTYKIVVWNRLIQPEGTYHEIRVYPFPMNFLSLDSLWYREEKKL